MANNSNLSLPLLVDYSGSEDEDIVTRFMDSQNELAASGSGQTPVGIGTQETGHGENPFLCPMVRVNSQRHIVNAKTYLQYSPVLESEKE